MDLYRFQGLLIRFKDLKQPTAADRKNNRNNVIDNNISYLPNCCSNRTIPAEYYQKFLYVFDNEKYKKLFK